MTKPSQLILLSSLDVTKSSSVSKTARARKPHFAAPSSRTTSTYPALSLLGPQLRHPSYPASKRHSPILRSMFAKEVSRRRTPFTKARREQIYQMTSISLSQPSLHSISHSSYRALNTPPSRHDSSPSNPSFHPSAF